MYKFIGSILILAACSGIGICKSREMQWHLNELEEVQKLFYLLRSELQYTRAPFAEVFEKISAKVQSPYGEWLLQLSQRLRERGEGSFWEIWCISIAQDLGTARLQSNDLEELKSVGKNLEYVESIDLYLEQMEYRIKNTREVYCSKRKLCRSLGIMGGIFLIILLL